MRILPAALISGRGGLRRLVRRGDRGDVSPGAPPTGRDAGGLGGNTSRSAGGEVILPSVPAPPAASTEVTGSYSLDVACADVPVIDVRSPRHMPTRT